MGMKNSKLHLIALATALFAASAVGADDPVRAFLKIDGIKGESTNAKHIDEIDVAAFKLGVLQSLSTTGGGGAGTGKATFAPITVFKGIDSASPLLFLHCATGQHHAEAVLTLTDHGRESFKVRLVDVIVTSCDVNSNNVENSELPLESVSLNFARIEITYQPFSAKGVPGTPITIKFDVAGNVAAAL